MQPEQEKYKYEYQGQEHQTELGLNWSGFKYRNYDYAIGRFMSVDPLAGKFPYMTVYQFAGNKPSWSVEIEGLESAVDLKMRLKEAENNAPKLDMSVDEYLEKTQPKLNLQNTNFDVNLRMSKGTLWTNKATPEGTDSPTEEEEKHLSNHHVWYIDSDPLFYFLNRPRPEGFKLNRYDKVIKASDKVIKVVDNKKNNTNSETTIDNNKFNYEHSNSDALQAETNSFQDNTANNNLIDTIIIMYGPGNKIPHPVIFDQAGFKKVSKWNDSLGRLGQIQNYKPMEQDEEN